MSIIPIPSTRVSDVFVRQRLLSQVESNQLDLFNLQNQISSGNRLNLPSDDAPAALRAVSLQGQLDQNAQFQTNVQTNQSYLSATDAAMSQIITMLDSAKAIASGAVGSTSSDAERASAASQIQDIITQLVNNGNQLFRGRYLFAGANTVVQPFLQTQAGIVYQGDNKSISSYSDVNALFNTNVTGDAAFGGFSQQVQGAVDLNPVLTQNTQLSDLYGGLGVNLGSLQISDGSQTSTVDLTSAKTLGDVVKLLDAHPPAGRTLTTQVTSTGLTLQLDAAGGGNLVVNEVGGGTTAQQLGIKGQLSNTGPLIGQDLNPALTLTTPLANILGTRASAAIPSLGANNDIIVTANANGPASNGVAVTYVDDSHYQAAPGIAAGNEFATYSTSPVPAKAVLKLTGPNNDLLLTANAAGTALNGVTVNIVNGGAIGNTATAAYNAGTKTLTLGIDGTGATSTNALITAINADGTFSAARDATAEPNVAGGFIAPADIRPNVGNTYNTGGAANTLFVHVQSGATTANNVISAINATGLFTATLNIGETGNNGTGLILDSATNPAASGVLAGGSGVAFDQTSGIQIVNGGKTYTIDFSTAKTVEDVLNTINGAGADVRATINQAGNGIDIQSRLSGSDFSIGENGGATATQLGVRSLDLNTPLSSLNYGQGVTPLATGPDFTITRKDGVSFGISLAGARTVGDVLNLINNNATNLGGGVPVVATMNAYGNGIQISDNDPAAGALSIAANAPSNVAQGLGLVPVGATSSPLATPAVSANGAVNSAGPNNDLIFTARQAGPAMNGVQVKFVDTGLGAGNETVNYNAGTKTLTFDMDTPTATANRVIAVLNANLGVSAQFAASLAPTDGSPNNGTGLVNLAATGTLSGGAPEMINGRDTNPQEVAGVFTALERLQAALQNNDVPGINRAASLLGGAEQNTNFARAALGAHEQSLTAIQGSLQNQQIELKSAHSQEVDVDLPTAISSFLGKQAAFQASLQASGLISKLTLLDYL
ncbi:MAG TPA: flagellar hook-associated protein FlgL [Pirellulales bacterium]|nr:flagellar hook-associated protein FlgL [Pirellulales bacterium]